MGVDYDGVGGIGVEITDEILENLIKSGHIKKDDWNEYGSECFDNLDISYQVAGNSYAGEYRYYWVVDGVNLDEINGNSQDFIDKLGEIGIKVTIKNLIAIEDLHVW